MMFWVSNGLGWVAMALFVRKVLYFEPRTCFECHSNSKRSSLPKHNAPLGAKLIYRLFRAPTKIRTIGTEIRICCVLCRSFVNVCDVFKPSLRQLSSSFEIIIIIMENYLFLIGQKTRRT